MDATTSALLKEVVNNLELMAAGLEPLKGLNRTLWFQPEFVGAFLSSTVALSIALWKGDWERRREKSNIRTLRVVRNYQAPIYIYRLVLFNRGKYAAKNIEIDVEEVYEDGDRRRDNFIPAPLRWTHINNATRDIFPNQVGYLDICEFRQEQDRNLRLAAPNIIGLSDIPYLGAGQTRLVLRHYQENGQTGKIEISIDWSGREEDLPNLDLVRST